MWHTITTKAYYDNLNRSYISNGIQYIIPKFHILTQCYELWNNVVLQLTEMQSDVETVWLINKVDYVKYFVIFKIIFL